MAYCGFILNPKALKLANSRNRFTCKINSLTTKLLLQIPLLIKLDRNQNVRFKKAEL